MFFTLDVLNMLKSRDSTFLQLLNISFIVVTLEVPKLVERLIEVNSAQL